MPLNVLVNNKEFAINYILENKQYDTNHKIRTKLLQLYQICAILKS